MLIFDQLKKNDPQLRAMAIAIICGLCVLVAGLWWVQIVSAREYQANQETQSSRTVRIPAVRGKILDRNGTVLAENRPIYNVSLYFDELRKAFDAASAAHLAAIRKELRRQKDAREKSLPPKFEIFGLKWPQHLSRTEQKEFIISGARREEIVKEARYGVSSNLVFQLGTILKLAQPIALNRTNFEHHYNQTRALPFPVLTNLTPAQIAIVQEKCADWPGVDLELSSTRYYPHQNTAAHVVGYAKRSSESVEGEAAFFSYRLNGFQGQLGVEAGMDKELRGKAGSKLVLINSAGYRQTDNIGAPIEPGSNVVLTIDLDLQKAAENALRMSALVKKAAVVMDVRSGDVLAMVSMPSYNPNWFIEGFPAGKFGEVMDNEGNKPLLNRATQGQYAPGSIFKTIVGMAALENGLDPRAQFLVLENPKKPGHGVIYVGGQPVEDTVAPGYYDFKRALIHSSNSYFITNGILTGMDKVVALGLRLHLGETTGLPTHQERPGTFPSLERVHNHWFQGNTANACIGQDPVLVNPLQMAVVAAAIGNGGTVIYPRLVDRVYATDPALPSDPVIFSSGRVRDRLGLSQRTMRILHEAMLADVEEAGGSGIAARIPEMRICAKTGTAQVKDTRNRTTTHNVWFMSFAPYPTPKYAVVVMVEGGTSGGGDCAPIAGEIYRSIVQWEKAIRPKSLATN